VIIVIQELIEKYKADLRYFLRLKSSLYSNNITRRRFHMDFNQWYESREVLPKILNYHSNLMEYFVQLKTVFDEQRVNEGIKRHKAMYVKKIIQMK